jgi:hypothetical protein
MGNPSTIWAQLAMPNPPAGSIPFVLSDGITIGTDVLNFFYDQVNNVLDITNGIEVFSFDAAAAGQVTINHVAGSGIMAAGSLSLTVLNNKILNSHAKVFIQSRSNDATATRFSVVLGGGGFLITANAAATANVTIDFFIVNCSVQTS